MSKKKRSKTHSHSHSHSAPSDADAADTDGRDGECFSRVNAIIRVHMHPRHIGNLRNGVEEHLNYYLMRYVPQVKGIVVGYDKIELAEDSARVVSGWPLLHVGVKCDMVVFAPEPGTQLVGKVTKIGFDHIGLLLFSLFNVTIPAERIRSSMRYIQDDYGEAWVEGDERICADSMVSFMVESLDIAEQDDLLYAVGSLLDPVKTGLAKVGVPPPPSYIHVQAHSHSPPAASMPAAVPGSSGMKRKRRKPTLTMTEVESEMKEVKVKVKEKPKGKEEGVGVASAKKKKLKKKEKT